MNFNFLGTHADLVGHSVQSNFALVLLIALACLVDAVVRSFERRGWISWPVLYLLRAVTFVLVFVDVVMLAWHSIKQQLH